MRDPHRKKWLKFREEVLEQDNYTCVRCGRSRSSGAILQVHHRQYLPNTPSWDHPYTFCETLCKGCHAKEHGKIQPDSGWEWVGYEDLGDLSGECEWCGTAIRYVFLVQHPKWPTLEVGEFCCDKLTGDTEASDSLKQEKRTAERRDRFLNSTRWKISEDGTQSIDQKRMRIEIGQDREGYFISANGTKGKK